MNQWWWYAYNLVKHLVPVFCESYGVLIQRNLLLWLSYYNGSLVGAYPICLGEAYLYILLRSCFAIIAYLLYCFLVLKNWPVVTVYLFLCLFYFSFSFLCFWGRISSFSLENGRLLYKYLSTSIFYLVTFKSITFNLLVLSVKFIYIEHLFAVGSYDHAGSTR